MIRRNWDLLLVFGMFGSAAWVVSQARTQTTLTKSDIVRQAYDLHQLDSLLQQSIAEDPYFRDLFARHRIDFLKSEPNAAMPADSIRGWLEHMKGRGEIGYQFVVITQTEAEDRRLLIAELETIHKAIHSLDAKIERMSRTPGGVKLPD